MSVYSIILFNQHCSVEFMLIFVIIISKQWHINLCTAHTIVTCHYIECCAEYLFITNPTNKYKHNINCWERGGGGGVIVGAHSSLLVNF